MFPGARVLFALFTAASGITIWSVLFLITRSKPALRSYWSALFLSILGYIGWYLPQVSIISGNLTLGYYIVDLCVLLTEISQKNLIFILHHTMTLIITTDVLSGPEKALPNVSLISALMSTSTIFLAWKNMARESALYAGWYPPISYDLSKIIFGFSFLIFRMILGTLVIFNTIPLVNRVSQIGLSISLCFNSYWMIEIFKIYFKSKK